MDFKNFKHLTSLQDRQRLQSGQAISEYFIVNWEGSWSGIRRILFVLVLQLCI